MTTSLNPYNGCYRSTVYLTWSFGVPGIYLGLPFRRSRPSHGGGPLTVAFTPARPAGPRAVHASVLYARGRFLSLALAPGGRQVPLASSAWDSATRNAAAAVVNSGREQRRQHPAAAPRPLPGDVPGDRGGGLEGAVRLPGAGAGIGVPAVR
jgi:hypothetical protein